MTMETTQALIIARRNALRSRSWVGAHRQANHSASATRQPTHTRTSWIGWPLMGGRSGQR